MDPANIDRRRGLLLGVSEASLTVRSMVIAGVFGKLEQRILSTTLKGESTRLIKAPAQWKTESAGHFTASYDLLVISGELKVNGKKVTPLTYLRIESTNLITEFSSLGRVTALLCADGPLKFDAAVSDASGDVIIGNTYFDDLGSRSLFSYRLSPVDSPRQFWLQHWGVNDDWQIIEWQSRTTAEESFVLRGSINVGVLVDGKEWRNTYNSGGYYSLPPNVPKQSLEIRGKEPCLTIYICPVNSKINTIATN